MKRRYSISQARARLSALVAEVLQNDEAVSIEHRDREERALLVSEKRYRYLEETVDRMTSESGRASPVAGSVELRGSDAELERDLARIREEAAALTGEKLAESI
jgi:PHD/YefM family antitoxin component YafN of YafNO toxin-antitoxin module